MIPKKLAAKAGNILVISHLVSGALTVLVAVAFSKLLGPQEFAIYSLCLAMNAASNTLCRLGINSALLTQKEFPTNLEFDTAITIMLTSAIVVALGLIALLPLLAIFSQVSYFILPGILTSVLLPVQIMSLPPLIRMERQLNYMPVVAIEIAGQLIGYIVGIGLTMIGFGYWGPLIGWCLRAVFQGFLPWVVLGQAPHLRWNKPIALRLLRSGVGYGIGSTFLQSRTFIILNIVGRFYGQSAVGYLALTIRAASLIMPFRSAVMRVMLPTVGPIINEKQKMASALNSATEIEVLLTIPFAIIAVALFESLVKIVLGSVWIPASSFFPWVVAGSILAASHAQSMSALLVAGHIKESIISSIVFLVSITTALFSLSWIGISGCAVAFILVWPAYWVQEYFSIHRLGTRWSKNGTIWAIAGAVTCVSWSLGAWLLVFPTVLIYITRSEILARFRSIIKYIR